MEITKAPILVIMGVSGCGKSTVGILLAKRLEIPFFDGDDFHSRENVEKMSHGISLDDNDRMGWLNTLNVLAKKNMQRGAVIACSALKEKYRKLISDSIEKNLVYIHLEGTFEEIMGRMKKREGHFMPAALLKSQFETLEPPNYAINVSVNETPDAIVQYICESLLKK